MRTYYALAIVAGLATLAPLVLAGPVLCTGTCEIVGGSLAYLPPAQAMTTGTSVHWIANDGNAHVNVDAGTSDGCLFTSFNGDDASPPIRFDATPTGLTATYDAGTVNESTVACPNAVQFRDGAGYVLHYFCALHPVLMKGALVVVAA